MKYLSERHYHELSVESGISDEIITAVGYETVEKKSDLARRGFSSKQRQVPGLLIPMYRPKSSVANIWQVKPDNPRKNASGRILKYEYPIGKAPVLDCPPVELMRQALFESKADIFITEGSKKASCAVTHGLPCLSLGGVYSWRSKNQYGIKTTIGELEDIDFEERRVFLAFDNDTSTNEMVFWALVRLAGVLERRGADVRFTILPEGANKGLDEFLVSGGTPVQLGEYSGKILPPPPIAYYTANDMGMANRVADMFVEEMVYDNGNDSWFVWDNAGKWIKDRTGNFARRYIIDYTDVIRDEARGLSDEIVPPAKKSDRQKHVSLATSYGNAGPVRGAEQLLRSRLVETNPGFNLKPDLLNCPNGTLDLTTLEFREHRSEDRLTTLAGASWPRTEKEKQCPMWLQFMTERFPDPETRNFIQRMCGLFVTGNSPEKAFFILRGEKDCGKTVFIEFLHWLLGDYANKVDKSTLTKQKGQEGKQQERAVELVGKRFVYVDESAQGETIDDAFIKEVTGGDTTLKFRRLYEQVNEVKAEFTLLLATNFKPRLTGNDDAIWRRCHLVEFGDSIPEEDQIGNFKEVLKEEAPGILAWCVEGYSSWAELGLETPPEVREWTLQYKDENDPLGRFMAECYDIGPEVEEHMTPDSLVSHYVSWCAANDITVKSLKEKSSLSKAVRSRWPIVNDNGIEKVNTRNRKLYHMKQTVDFRATDGLQDMLDE